MSVAVSATHLSGSSLRRGLIAGIQRVIAGRDELDRINVFPVPDHDTGSNLAQTLGAVWQGLSGSPLTGAGATLRQAANDAADSARGNAGAILAQFLHGAAESPSLGPRLTSAMVAEAVARGSAHASAAMAMPQEGTILTVMQAFADGWQGRREPGNLRRDFSRALAEARAALLQTRRQVPALRAAGVVDAGAQGFVSLLEGINDYVEQGRARPRRPMPPDLAMAGVDTARSGEGSHRCCAECVVNADAVDRPGLKAGLLALSLSDQVISGTREQVRLHAHVDDPVAFFAIAARFGALSSIRVEDLTGTNPPTAGRRPAVAVATDSGADIPAEEMERLNIHLVPQRLAVSGRDQIDRVSITSHELYHAMRTGLVPPRTSQPSPGDFRRLFEHLLGHQRSVVEVSLARALSGTLQSAERAAARCGAGRVSVFDTGSVSAGQGLLTLWAAEAASAGMTAERIVAGLAAMRIRTSVYAVVRDIQYGVRGGRAPRVALTLTRLFRFYLTVKIRPNGKLGLLGALWGGRNLPERFAHSVIRRLDPKRSYRLIISHCDCADDARRVQATMRGSSLQLDRCWVVEAGVAIGAHAGPGSLVIGVQDYTAPAP